MLAPTAKIKIVNQLNVLQLWMLVSLASVLACNTTPGKKEENTSAHNTATTAAAPASARPVHWSYTEEGGPAGWGKLSPVYAACDSGKSQSPVNLLSDVTEHSPDWNIDYKTSALQIAHTQNEDELINNGHTIQVTPEKGSQISYEGKIYQLKQFHFHTPSEHTINGKHFPMEIHLVHQADDNSLAVIGVLVMEGKHNSNFDQLIKYLPNVPGEKKTHDSVNIEIGITVPKHLYAYHYIGSLTTPPCSENVQWLVLKNQITMSKEQITAFSSRLKNNNRPVQPLNERKLTIDDITSKN
jgi:carbonic anhydrase